MAKTPFKLLALTQEHKDFLQRYAQNRLGSSSRTKAILALIEDAMRSERRGNSDQNSSDCNGSNAQNALKNQAIKNKEQYIQKYHAELKNRSQKIQEAKANKDHELAKKLAQSKISIPKKRIQFSLPIYDYEYLEKLAESSQSSLQYYITVVLLESIYNKKRLLGNEIEVLKKSNYELYKIGVNVNQIARANNAGDSVDLPINALYNFIKNHVELVQDLLNKNING